jgi:hypothetical protein
MVSCQTRRRINRDETKNASLLREIIATFQLQNSTQRPDIPTFWSLPQRRIFKCIRKQYSGFNVHAIRLTAFGLGADGVEVHEPRLEQRPRHCLQCLVHLPVQLDLVVQRAEDVGDGALFGQWGNYKWTCCQDGGVEVWHGRPVGVANDPLPDARVTQVERGVSRIDTPLP